MIPALLLSCAPPPAPADPSSDTGTTETGSPPVDTAPTDTAPTDTAPPADTSTGDTGTDTGDTGVPTDTGADPVATTDLSVVSIGTWVGDSPVEDALSFGRFVGDLDGDGTDDVALLGTVAATDGFSAYERAVFYVPGGQAVRAGMSRAELATASIANGYPSWPETALPAGDFDDDGAPDLWVPAGNELDGAYLFRGPPSRWSFGETLADTDAGWAVGTEAAVTDIDLDRDGVPDAAWLAGTDGAGDIGSVTLTMGGPLDALRSTRIPCEDPYDLDAGDLDGDGLPDLLVARAVAGEVLVIGGEEALLSDGVACDVAAGTVMTGTAVGRWVGAVGDWTGDGADDWAVVNHGASPDVYAQGAVLFVAGGPDATTAGALDLDAVSVGSFVGDGEEARLGSNGVKAAGDVDGDGVPEIQTAMRSPSTGESLAVLIPSGTMAGAWAPLPAGTLRLTGGDPDERVGLAPVTVGDFDGDGTPELLAGAGYWAGGIGREYLFSVP
jgi:hypothetical protein